MKKLLTLIVVFSSLFVTHSAKAWRSYGHSCIAYIAEQHLTPEAKRKCDYYLAHTLTYYALWMDSWRGAKAFYMVNSSHSVVVNEDGKGLSLKGGRPNGRVIGQFRNALAELCNGKYKELPDSVVRQRIINMVHYIPDMHCPSHVRFPKTAFPQYNYTKVLRNGKPTSYHGIWDSAPALGRKIGTVGEYAKEVDKVSRKQVRKWQSGTLEDWALDIIEGGHQGRAIVHKDIDMAKLTNEQWSEFKALSNKMVLMAAYRLAYTLNTIFADGNIEYEK